MLDIADVVSLTCEGFRNVSTTASVWVEQTFAKSQVTALINLGYATH
jgi:hypothetical protein